MKGMRLYDYQREVLDALLAYIKGAGDPGLR